MTYLSNGILNATACALSLLKYLAEVDALGFLLMAISSSGFVKSITLPIL